MKVEFNDRGVLVIKADNNTEMVALDYWSKGLEFKSDNDTAITVDFKSHLRTNSVGSSK